MKILKKIIIISMLMLLLGIAGCGEKKGQNDEQADVNNKSQQEKVNNEISQEEVIKGTETYVLTDEEQQELLDEAVKTVEEAVNMILTQKEAYPYVQDIIYNDAITEFIVKVDQNGYREENDMVPLILETVGKSYQMTNGISEEKINIKVTVEKN